MELAGERTSLGQRPQSERVLVFSVDDGLFGVHLDWVEAVYEARSVEMHRVRVDKGPWHSFLLHRGEPALRVDLREAFEMAELVGQPERAACAVVQSGGYRFAVAIDHVSGVQDLALDARAPIPSSLLRDGGIPVGHLVQMDERMLVVLDPHRLLSGAQRDALEPIWARARAYGERHERMRLTWAEICAAPTEENIRVFARLSARNGRPKAAAAARTVLKAMADPNYGVRTNGTVPGLVDQLVAGILRRSHSAASGVLSTSGEQAAAGKVFIAGGRVIDAQCGSKWGRMALDSLLAQPEGSVSFSERDLSQHPERISESSAASLISSLESAASEQRRRRAR
jgi:chemotaxis signal transduction protein